MTLDEAIKHAEEVSEEKENEAQDLEYSKLDWRHEANQCSKCAEEHRQLAEWLRDYKRLLEQEPMLDKIRAEIWDLQYGPEEKIMTNEDRADAYNNAINQVIEIIDKYNAESEG